MSSYVQSNDGSSTNASSATLTLASTPVAGDVLCLFVVTSTTAVFAPSDSQGNVWKKGVGVFNGTFGVYVTTSNGAAGPYTATVGWTSGAGTKTFAIGEWSGPPGVVFLNGPPWDAARYTDDTGAGVSFASPGPGALVVLFSYAVSNAAPATTGTGVMASVIFQQGPSVVFDAMND